MPRRRYELTDEQYECIEHLLPEVKGRGCPYNDHRKVINGIFWVLRSGAPWRDMPERQGQLEDGIRPLPALGRRRHP
ncbi:transposase [Salinibacter ruber]|uniref:transposase n=1 Tax=Salinibacter ruber TaxID=146919 RepID=UPI003C6DB801